MDLSIEHLNKYSQGANKYKSGEKKVKQTTYCYSVWQSLDNVFRAPRPEGEQARSRRVSGHEDEVEKIAQVIKQKMWKNQKAMTYNFSTGEPLPHDFDPFHVLEGISQGLRERTDLENSLYTASESELEESSESDSDDQWVGQIRTNTIRARTPRSTVDSDMFYY